MKLYHFTAAIDSHLGSILRERQIRPSESNLSLTVPHAGPDVVWLTTEEEMNPPWEHRGTPGIRTTARLTVELPDARHWPEWWAEQGGEQEAYDRLAETGGDPTNWYVVPRPVPHVEVVAIKVFHPRTGERLYFEGADVRRLFESRGRQRALALPVPTRISGARDFRRCEFSRDDLAALSMAGSRDR